MYLDEKSFTSPPVESKPNIYALPTLIAWLEKQPTEQRYSFADCNGACLLDQYLFAHGVETFQHGGLGEDNHVAYVTLSVATGWDASVAYPDPLTFGSALSRARALLP